MTKKGHQNFWVSGQFVAGQFVADNSSRTIRGGQLVAKYDIIHYWGSLMFHEYQG